MADFRSFKTSRRLRAAPMQPVVDPAGWEPEALCQVEDWSYKITARDVAELKDGIAEVRRRGVPIVEVAREDFPLKDFADALGDADHAGGYAGDGSSRAGRRARHRHAAKLPGG